MWLDRSQRKSCDQPGGLGRGSPGFGGHSSSSSGTFAPVSSPAGTGILPTPEGRPEGQTSHCVRKTHRGPAETMHLQNTETSRVRRRRPEPHPRVQSHP